MTRRRLEAFSDGVFAAAITLLAFEVRLPPLPADLTDQTSGVRWPGARPPQLKG